VHLLARLILSGSGRTLAVVPDARLDADVGYCLDATTLADVQGGVILVPAAAWPVMRTPTGTRRHGRAA